MIRRNLERDLAFLVQFVHYESKDVMKNVDRAEKIMKRYSLDLDTFCNKYQRKYDDLILEEELEYIYKLPNVWEENFGDETLK